MFPRRAGAAVPPGRTATGRRRSTRRRDRCDRDDHEHRGGELDGEPALHPLHYRRCARLDGIIGTRSLSVPWLGASPPLFVAWSPPVSVALGSAHAVAAPLPGVWCGPDESPADRPDVVAGNQIHVVYVYPAGAPDRFSDIVGQIVRDLAGVDAWWRSARPFPYSPLRSRRVPGLRLRVRRARCVERPLTHPRHGVHDRGQRQCVDVGRADLSATVSTDAPRSTSSTTTARSTRVSVGWPSQQLEARRPDSRPFVFLQVPAGMRGRRVGERQRVAGAHRRDELLHTFNDTFRPNTAPNACADSGHVCDSQADVLSTGTIHPSPRLNDAILDVDHDDYYDHPGIVVGHPRLRLAACTSSSAAGVAHRAGRRHRPRRVVSVPDGTVCSDVCTRRFDGGARRGPAGGPAPGLSPPAVGWRVLGARRGVRRDGRRCRHAVTAVFGQAVVVTGSRAGSRRHRGAVRVDSNLMHRA